ncbi:MAG: hypothetical protein E6R03_08230 [Hyphomicrobiaceae bacterium]|nr:MAG: hypothetical protein E6R03_08230 [Hyphomicrobiaceae bacterium]
MRLRKYVRVALNPAELRAARAAVNAAHNFDTGSAGIDDLVPGPLRDAHHALYRTYELPISIEVDEKTGEISLAKEEEDVE